MKTQAVLIAILRLATFCWAVNNDGQIPLQDDGPDVPITSKSHRVAIIGAGAGGSSAAYHLRKFSDLEDSNPPLDITVFESNPRIGGRTTTVNALDDPRYPVEVGASIFVKVNHILFNASRDFGLASKTKLHDPSTKSDFDLGIWDGTDFVFTQASGDDSSWKGWWDIAKLLWKYGLSPIRTQRLMKSTVGKFLRFYEEPVFPFRSLHDAVEENDLLEFTGATGEQTLQAAGISESFSRDIIQASTRVNYAQNLGGIHGLETMVCMATEGAMAIEGGNWQIFEHAVKHSGASVTLNTAVTNIETTKEKTYLIHTNTTTTPAEFDTVILAAPYQFASINFSPQLLHPPPSIPYVSLYVTLFTTSHLMSPTFFNLTNSRGIDAVGPTKFWSISTLRTIHTSELNENAGSKPQYLYKIFSPQAITGSFLASLFDFSHQNTSEIDPITSISKKDITWSHEKLWHSYPYEIPRTNFYGFRLDGDDGKSYFEREEAGHDDSVESLLRINRESTIMYGGFGEENDKDEFADGKKKRKGGGIWYTSSIEPFISTMETSALAGMNVARLILDDLKSSQDEMAKI